MVEHANSREVVTLEEQVITNGIEREAIGNLQHWKGTYHESRVPRGGQATVQAGDDGPLAAKAAGRGIVPRLNLEQGFRRLTWMMSFSLAFFFIAEGVSAWATDAHAAYGFLAFAVPSLIAPWIVFLVVGWIVRGFIGGPDVKLPPPPARANPAAAGATRLGQRPRDVLPRLAFFSRDHRRRQSAQPTPSDMPC